jgi:hypothetical protein
MNAARHQPVLRLRSYVSLLCTEGNAWYCTQRVYKPLVVMNQVVLRRACRCRNGQAVVELVVVASNDACRRRRVDRKPPILFQVCQGDASENVLRVSLCMLEATE